MTKEKILVVDDEPFVIEYLEGLISSFNYSVYTAQDGLQAVDLLRKNSFPLVITDIIMPNMDGMELLSFVQEFYPETDVIAVTGKDKRTTVIDLIKAGASDFLLKPISSIELEAKLQRVFRERALMSELHRKESQYRVLVENSPN